jgi:hypothetical protein
MFGSSEFDLSMNKYTKQICSSPFTNRIFLCRQRRVKLLFSQQRTNPVKFLR